MLCDHQLVIEHINDYVEDGFASDEGLASSNNQGKNKLSVELKQQMENMFEHCSDCRETHQQCVRMYQMSHNWQEQPVPEWHRTSFAVRPPVKSNLWLNWSSLATSSLAILLVIFQLEVNSGVNGLTISFGGSQAESKIAEMVESQLAEYKDQQQMQFQVKLKDELQKQDTRTKLRLATWTEKNREERKQDLNFVMTGLESQRYEDRKQIDRQVAYLADNQIENNQVINQLIQNVGSGRPK